MKAGREPPMGGGKLGRSPTVPALLAAKDACPTLLPVTQPGFMNEQSWHPRFTGSHSGTWKGEGQGGYYT